MWPSLFCDGSSLRPQAEELARDHRVVMIDPPGHGRTPAPPARFRLEATAVALGELMDTCRAPRAVLVGNAWGGMVATQLAITQPDRIVALVLMNCPFHEWAGIKRLKLRMAHWLLVTLGPRRMANMVFSDMVSPETRAASPDRYLEVQRAMRVAERAGFARCAASAMFDRPQLGPFLHLVRAPTLVIAGDRDPIYPVDEARAEAALIPGARLEIIKGTAHLSGWESPGPVNALIRGFVEALPAPARVPQAPQ
jgi:3-oxoadipate enol-lactonase